MKILKRNTAARAVWKRHFPQNELRFVLNKLFCWTSVALDEGAENADCLSDDLL